MSEILNCPICGAKATKVINPKGDERWVMFKCSTLGCIQQQGFYRDEKEAIEQWNTRKPMREIVEKIERHPHFEDYTTNEEVMYVYDVLEIVKEVGGMND